MGYEPGSTDCRLLIDAKHHLEEALLTLYAMPHTDHIQRQLKAVYRQLEGMHDLKRARRISGVTSECRLVFRIRSDLTQQGVSEIIPYMGWVMGIIPVNSPSFTRDL